MQRLKINAFNRISCCKSIDLEFGDWSSVSAAAKILSTEMDTTRQLMPLIPSVCLPETAGCIVHPSNTCTPTSYSLFSSLSTDESPSCTAFYPVLYEALSVLLCTSFSKAPSMCYCVTRSLRKPSPHPIS